MRSIRWSALLRFALRDLRGGIHGARALLFCVGIGVCALVSVAYLNRSLAEGLARDGRDILGGDVAVSLAQRAPLPEEIAFFDSLGSVERIFSMNAMARGGAKETATLTSLLAVPPRYPRHGEIETRPLAPLGSLLEKRDGVYGAVVGRGLLTRLDVHPGERLKIGQASFEIRGEVIRESSGVGTLPGFGARVFIARDALSEMLPEGNYGNFFKWRFLITLPDSDVSDKDVISVANRIKERFPTAGLVVTTRFNAIPRLGRELERFTQFLTLAALTILLMGGGSVVCAAQSFLRERRRTLATYKVLGASGFEVSAILLLEMAFIGGVAAIVGAFAGAGLVSLTLGLLRDVIPVPVALGVYPGEILLGFSYGSLITIFFSTWKLGTAHDISVGTLVRGVLEPLSEKAPRPVYLLCMLLAGAGFVSLILLVSWNKTITIIYMLFVAGIFTFFYAFSDALIAFFRKLPKPPIAELRLAMNNIHRPGALTRQVFLSLGIGLAFVVTLLSMTRNLERQLTGGLPKVAPDFYVINIPDKKFADFKAFVSDAAPDALLYDVPMMRGRITALKDVPVAEYDVRDAGQWVLRGDRGITFSSSVPKGSRLVAGEWSPKICDEKPCVSLEQEVAKNLDVDVGDSLTVNILGRSVRARITSLRALDWRSLAINFVMVFTPATFKNAPFTRLATMTYAAAPLERVAEGRLLRKISSLDPRIFVVPVKEIITQTLSLLQSVALGIQSVGFIAIAAVLVVLGNALSLGRKERLRDDTILKTIGASRMQILRIYLLEFSFIGAIASVTGLFFGNALAYFALEMIFKVPFVFSLSESLGVALIGVVSVTLMGMVSIWSSLGKRSGRVLAAT